MSMPKKMCLFFFQGRSKISTSGSQIYQDMYVQWLFPLLVTTACFGEPWAEATNVLECYCGEKPNIYPDHLQESFSGGSDPSEPLQANTARFFDSLIPQSLDG